MVLVYALILFTTNDGFGQPLRSEFAETQVPVIAEIASKGAFDIVQGKATQGRLARLTDRLDLICAVAHDSGEARVSFRESDSRAIGASFSNTVRTKQWREGNQISVAQCELVLDRLLPVCGYELTSKVFSAKPSGATWSLSWRTAYRGVPFGYESYGAAQLDCETGRPQSIHFPIMVWPPDSVEAAVTPEEARTAAIAEAFRLGTTDFEWAQEPLKVITFRDPKPFDDYHKIKATAWEACPRGEVMYEAVLKDKARRVREGHPLVRTIYIDAQTGAVVRQSDNADH